VQLDLDFEYAGRIVRTALGPVFNRSADTLVDAFCARARSLYGEP
jgi:ribosome-associated toxin RatA of RatAB toxin-antitoxin module